MAFGQTPLPWWADPTNEQNKAYWTDYSRTYNPTGYTSPDDANYQYQTWLQQNYDVSRFTPTSTPLQTQYGGEGPGEPGSYTAAPGYVAPTNQTVVPTYGVPISTTSTGLSSATSQIPATTSAANRIADSNLNRTDPNVNDDVWDGFARRYAPSQRDLLFSNQGPGIVLRDYLNQDGRTNYLNMEGDLARYAAVAPEIYDILLAGNMDPDVIGDDDIINWMADLFGEQTKEGGASPTLENMLAQFMAGINNADSGLYQDVMLDSYGNPNTTQAQIQKINEMIPYLNTFSGNYRYTDRMKKDAARLGQEYASRVANGDAAGQTYAQYLQQHFLR